MVFFCFFPRLTALRWGAPPKQVAVVQRIFSPKPVVDPQRQTPSGRDFREDFIRCGKSRRDEKIVKGTRYHCYHRYASGPIFIRDVCKFISLPPPPSLSIPFRIYPEKPLASKSSHADFFQNNPRLEVGSCCCSIKAITSTGIIAIDSELVNANNVIRVVLGGGGWEQQQFLINVELLRNKVSCCRKIRYLFEHACQLSRGSYFEARETSRLAIGYSRVFTYKSIILRPLTNFR